MNYNIINEIPKICPKWESDSVIPCETCKIICFAHGADFSVYRVV